MAHECALQKRKQIPRTKSHESSDIVRSPKRAASTVYLSRSITCALLAIILWIIRAHQTIVVIVFILKSMMSVDHHSLVIFAKSKQYIERYTEIKVSSRSSLPISTSIPHNHTFVGRHYYIVFELLVIPVLVIPVFLLIFTSLSLSSNFIKYERATIISQCHVSTLDYFVLRQFSLDV